MVVRRRSGDVIQPCVKSIQTAVGQQAHCKRLFFFFFFLFYNTEFTSNCNPLDLLGRLLQVLGVNGVNGIML